tara:strand:+ start:414 stop:1292 length:879 start_codon:yes stop_codon:yes gene_type:complete
MLSREFRKIGGRGPFELSNYPIESDQLNLLNELDPRSNSLDSNACPQEQPLNEVKLNTQKNSPKIDKAPEMLLIVDTETTGLNADLDKCIEVGVILFNVPNRSTLAQQSFLIPSSSNNAESINKIPVHITKLNQPFTEAISYLKALIDSADLIIAHNAEFDRQWFGKGSLPFIQKPWLCSMEDIKWPADRNLRARPSVRDLALAYEVPVWNAHRALTDCIYLAEVFRRCPDLEDLIEKGLEPRKLMKAQISYEQRHLARDAGFRWNDPIAGAWSRRLSEREALELNFPVEAV